MYKKVIFGEELHQACSETIELISKAVKATLGPSGKLALLDRGDVPSLITKDGVTVCKSTLPLEDPVMNKIGEKIKEIAVKTNQEAGDGTTTSIVLAEALYNESMKKVAEGIDPVLIKEEIEKEIPIIISELKKKSKIIETLKQMEDVATISANGDRIIGQTVAKAIDAVGQDGFVTLQEGEGFEPSVEIIEGTQIDKGASSYLFLKDRNNIEFEEPFIFVFDGKIEDPTVLHNIYQSYVRGKPFVVIGQLSDIALKYLSLNTSKDIMKACHINPPMHGNTRHNMLIDISTTIGAELINTSVCDPQELLSLPIDCLGSSEKISIDMKKTVIMNGSGDGEVIFNRIEELKEQLEVAKSQYDKDILKQRIGSLACGIALIGVNGKTDDEMKERKDRFEDSLNATRAALLEGVVPGGGFTLYNISQKLKRNTVGSQILKEALKAPISQIITNTGRDPKDILPKITLSKGYNARNNKFTNLEKEGIIDPTKVITSAIRNATSIVDLLINLEVITVVIKDKSSMPDLGGLFQQ